MIGIIGGISALALFVAFGLSAAPFRTLLYAFVLIVGMVVPWVHIVTGECRSAIEAIHKEVDQRFLG